MGNVSKFETGQIVDACLVGASVTKTATKLGVSRATVSKDLSAYTNYGKISGKNSRQKSALTEYYIIASCCTSLIYSC
jgi:predicted transcriptional regulator